MYASGKGLVLKSFVCSFNKCLVSTYSLSGPGLNTEIPKWKSCPLGCKRQKITVHKCTPATRIPGDLDRNLLPSVQSQNKTLKIKPIRRMRRVNSVILGHQEWFIFWFKISFRNKTIFLNKHKNKPWTMSTVTSDFTVQWKRLTEEVRPPSQSQRCHLSALRGHSPVWTQLGETPERAPK